MKWIFFIVLSCLGSFVFAQETAKPNEDKTTVTNTGTSDSKQKKSYLSGIASYYSKSLEGSPTSSGERFTHSKYTCASNHVKLGTWLKVTNTVNGKSVVVKVNDRMHPKMAKKGRVVDLTITAFSAIGNTNSGLLKVKVEVLGKTKPKTSK
jgi:rare lipoprotein A (peptidoglycan hydrolase)